MHLLSGEPMHDLSGVDRMDWRRPIDYALLPQRAELGGFDFVALRTGEQIFSDGNEMRHCVSTYTRQVSSGQSRLFSIRRDGRRIATLELQSNSNSLECDVAYSMGQLRGPCNTQPSAEICGVAKSFLDNVNTTIAQSIQKPSGSDELQLLKARRRILVAFRSRASCG